MNFAEHILTMKLISIIFVEFIFVNNKFHSCVTISTALTKNWEKMNFVEYILAMKLISIIL